MPIVLPTEPHLEVLCRFVRAAQLSGMVESPDYCIAVPWSSLAAKGDSIDDLEPDPAGMVPKQWSRRHGSKFQGARARRYE